MILVKPGERIALDGRVAAGASSVNQAPITGESIPVTKAVGDPVFAGTINERGTLEVAVTAAKGEGTLDRIARSIQEAQADKAPAQRFVDRFAADLHAGGVRDGDPRRRRPGGHRARQLPRLVLPGAGAARARLPVRAGDLDPGHRGVRARWRGPARHPHQGRRPPRERPQDPHRRPRQDRHAHPRHTGAHRSRQPRRTDRRRGPAHRRVDRSALRAPGRARDRHRLPRPARRPSRGSRRSPVAVSAAPSTASSTRSATTASPRRPAMCGPELEADPGTARERSEDRDRADERRTRSPCSPSPTPCARTAAKPSTTSRRSA